jgi:hypothetical protein
MYNPLKEERRYIMARKKRTSPAFEKLGQRLSGLKAIDEKLDLGNSLTVEGVTQKLLTFNTELEDYNILLGNVDAKLNSVSHMEEIANNLSETILIAVAAKYGNDSNEYEKAGGKRKSDIKRNGPRKSKKKPGEQ